MVNAFKTFFQDEKSFHVKCNTSEKVEPQFRFNRQRNMPIAKFRGVMGYYIFPSENSFDQFKQSQFEHCSLNAEGVGLPLLHIHITFNVLGKITGNKPCYLVHRFLLRRLDEPPPTGQYEVVAQNHEFCLLKMPFCEIYRRSGIKETEYKLSFPFGPDFTDSYLMKRSFINRNLYTFMGDSDLRWHVHCAFPINRDHYRLEILGNYTPSLLDDSAAKNEKKKLRRAKEDKKPGRTIIAHYTRTYRDFFPHKVAKRSNLFIGEHSQVISYGIQDVPWTTQVIACQALLIQYIEHARRENRKKSS